MKNLIYILATPKARDLAAFERVRQTLSGSWLVGESAEELAAILDRVTPRYIFFPHLSHFVAGRAA